MPSGKSSTKPKPKTTAPQLSFEAIGTLWEISLTPAVDDDSKRELLAAIEQRIEKFDLAYSRFRADSLVTKMSQRPGKYRLPADAGPLLTLYGQLYEATAGRMTPLIGQLLADAGYDAGYSLKAGPMQATPAWADRLDYEPPFLNVKQPALLDLGAAGKGYLVDIVSELIAAAGIADFCVNAGGDMLVRQTASQPLRVGLEHPDHPDEVIGIANLHNQSLCGSAGNRRAWGNFTHIIDPQTQSSPSHLKATWVVADNTMLADGLATALFFADARQLSQLFSFEYAIIHADYSLEHSKNFPAQFFTEQRVGN